MKASPRVILRTALIVCAVVATAGCASSDNGAQTNANSGYTPTTAPSATYSYGSASTDNNRAIGNGAFGETPP